MAYPGEEKRSYKRIDHRFYTSFRIYPEVKTKEVFNWDMTVIKNLSAGGLLFNYNKELLIGMLLEFKIIFPASTRPIQCSAMVLRVDKNPLRRIYSMAVRFIEINDSDREAIDRLARRESRGI